MAIIKIAPIIGAKNLETALNKVRKNDTITFTNKQFLQNSLTINDNVTIDGQNKGSIILKEDVSNIIIQRGNNITFKNMSIVLAKFSNLITNNQSTNITLENVNFILPKKIDTRDIYPIIFKNEANINIKLINVTTDVWVSSSDNITIENSSIGSIYNNTSTIQTSSIDISNSTINNTNITSYFEDIPCEINAKNISTNGKLHLTDTKGEITGIYAKQIEDFNIKKFEDESMIFDVNKIIIVENNEEQLHIDNISNNLDNSLDSSLLTVLNSNLLLTNTTLPKLNFKNMLINSKLGMDEVKGDTNWHMENSQTKIRNTEMKGKKAIDKLDELIGLKDAKEQIKKLLSVAIVNKKRQDQGLEEIKGMSNHMVFAGAAGTGKTTVAKIFGEALYQEGILKKDTFIQATRKDLVGRYVGETALKTNALIQKARGGILFIDEAYSLKSESASDFAPEAVAELIACMEEYRDDLVVILAGYTKDMENFIYHDNEGLPSRFNSWVYFDSYEEPELNQILRLHLKSQGFDYSDPITDKALSHYMHQLISILGDNEGHINGNGRFIRNFVQAIITNQSLRIASEPNADLAKINKDDILKGAKAVIQNSTEKTRQNG